MSKIGACLVFVLILIQLCVAVDNVTTVLNNEYTDEPLVSIECLRCLCLFSSNCEPVGCDLKKYATMLCGYFQLSYAVWLDCGAPGNDQPSCGDDFECSTLCVQRYVKRYVVPGNCPFNCEGYARLMFGGPGGCNNPRTMTTWAALQQVPGCKGVQ